MPPKDRSSAAPGTRETPGSHAQQANKPEEFPPYAIAMTLGGRLRQIIVAPDALLLWWGANSGPQTAEGLVADHLGEIEAAATAKLVRDAMTEDLTITIAEEDLD